MLSFIDTALDSISWSTGLLAVAVCLLLCVYAEWAHAPRGPYGIPYIGYYPFLRADYNIQLLEMRKKYGEVYCFKCFGQTYVHLSNLKFIREAHVTKADCFSGRTENFSVMIDSLGQGVGVMNGEPWKVMRKFLSQQMREYGLGKKSQELLMGDGLQRTVDTLKKNEGRNFDALAFFTSLSTEAIRRLLMSGVPITDTDIKSLNEDYKSVLEITFGSTILLAGPLLKYVLLPFHGGFKKYRNSMIRMDSIFRKIIRQHERGFNKDDIRDLIDAYIGERKALEKSGDPKSKIFSESALVGTLVQFFGDGALTVGLFIAAILKDLADRPGVQKEIQKEIDEVVGTNRLPSWDDKNKTPYTMAAIYETQRISDFLPTFPSLECTKATTIGGCPIPKGALTLINFCGALHDPDVYENPDTYDPSRFLLNENKKTKSELPITFGVGRRSCIGEPLAIMETYLVVATVLQNFDLHPAENVPLAVENDAASLNILFRATRRT